MIVEIIKTVKNVIKIETIFSTVNKSTVILNSGIRMRVSHITNNDDGPGENIHLHDNSVLIGVPKDSINYNKRQNENIINPEQYEVEPERQEPYKAGKTIKAKRKPGCRRCGKRRKN
tara:strand:+ start:296 stop:646 length:351 start_codon:yes stop_codon:yes gene_type:complete